jgi:hypothetical protein
MNDAVGDLQREIEISELRQRLAAAEHELLCERQPWRRHLLATDSDLQRLIVLVAAAFPFLQIPVDDAKGGRAYREKFAVAFAWLGLGSTGRINGATNEKVYVDHFCNRCMDWGKSYGAPSWEIDEHVLIPAAAAWGDVAWRLGGSSYVAALGIETNFGAGRPPIAKWRDVLKGSATLRPPEVAPAQRQDRQSLVGWA